MTSTARNDESNQEAANGASSPDPSVFQDWLDNHVDRRLGAQESARNTSLLIVTFTEGIAAALVASSIQVGQHRYLLITACILLAVGFFSIFLVLALQRSTLTNEKAIFALASSESWSAKRLSDELRATDLSSVETNEATERAMLNTVFCQVAVAAACSALSILAMLLPA